MAEHELKTWPEHFQAVKAGEKRFEIRRNDRRFAVGDTLRLREWSPSAELYTGDEVTVDVLHMLPGGAFDLGPDSVAMSIALRSAVSAERPGLGEPVAWTTGTEIWFPTKHVSETVTKLTRDAQPEYGFVHPLFTHPAPVKADTAGEGWSEALARLQATDAALLDEAALRLSDMGAVDLGNAVVAATVSITEARDAMLSAVPAPPEGEDAQHKGSDQNGGEHVG